MAKSIVSGVVSRLTSVIAWQSDPGPLLAVLVTMYTVSSKRRSIGSRSGRSRRTRDRSEPGRFRLRMADAQDGCGPPERVSVQIVRKWNWVERARIWSDSERTPTQVRTPTLRPRTTQSDRFQYPPRPRPGQIGRP